ncbi:MAG: DNA repair protein RecN [Candidatus Schekmanbacteria bacterium]|nr:DNA repair protein RecN [Candidatus Schekmanbacteria bacterium]
MLRELRIKNFAVIDQLTVEFAPGFNVISGETGSGKSMIITALEFVLGAKASSEYIRSGMAQMIIEAVFHLPEQSLQEKLDKFGISGSDENTLILRRRLNQQGKSSCYANDCFISLATLNDIGQDLVDIHGQHQHQLLLRQEKHIDFLDGFAGLLTQRNQLADLYQEWQEVLRQLSRLKQQKDQQSMKKALLTFQVQEIEQANLQPGEEERLKTERNLLNNANKILESGHWIYQALYESEGAVSEALSGVENKLRDLSRIDPELAPLEESSQALKYQVADLASAINDYLSQIEYNPERLNQVEERLMLIDTLKRKYGPGIGQILDFQQKITSDLEQISHQDHDLIDLERKQKALAEILNHMATEFSQIRRKKTLDLEAKLEAELMQLGMLQAMIKVQFSPQTGDDPAYQGNAQGLDNVEFLFSANPGEEPKPLAKVASGGELSRIMLVLKSLISNPDQTGSLVFDEVDTGISGRVAEVVGQKLKQSASCQQIICITHLPQIAALADQHFVVQKAVNQGQTFTGIIKLDLDARIKELARMLAGSQITASALTHAEKMLNAAG